MVNFPVVEWVEQDVTIDPSGSRHLSSPGAGFVKNLNTGAGGVLDFGPVNNNTSLQITDTKCTYFRASTMGDASGIFNFKFFVVSSTDWSTGTFRFLERKTIDFVQNLDLTAADTDTPTTVPGVQNVLSTAFIEAGFQRGAPFISGILDNDVSQYIYLATLVDTDVPAAQYGGPGGGGFRYRLLYDFS